MKYESPNLKEKLEAALGRVRVGEYYYISFQVDLKHREGVTSQLRKYGEILVDEPWNPEVFIVPKGKKAAKEIINRIDSLDGILEVDLTTRAEIEESERYLVPCQKYGDNY